MKKTLWVFATLLVVASVTFAQGRRPAYLRFRRRPRKPPESAARGGDKSLARLGGRA